MNIQQVVECNNVKLIKHLTTVLSSKHFFYDMLVIFIYIHSLLNLFHSYIFVNMHICSHVKMQCILKLQIIQYSCTLRKMLFTPFLRCIQI